MAKWNNWGGLLKRGLIYLLFGSWTRTIIHQNPLLPSVDPFTARYSE